MADLSKVKLNGITYNFKDTVAREQFANKNFLEIIELGNFSMEDYDWEISNYVSDLTDTGFYHAYETEDGFDYWIEVKNNGAVIQQSYFYGEEPEIEHVRIGFNTTDPIQWNDWTVKMTYDFSDRVFAKKDHFHYETVTINQDIRTYLNNSTVFNDLAGTAREKILYVINNSDNKTYYVLYSYMSAFTPRQIGQLYFSLSEPAHIYRRTGTRSNSTNTWSEWIDFTPGADGGGNAEFITDLGTFSLSDYEDDLYNFLATITESGFYIAQDDIDHFTYFIRVERADNQVGTMWWSSEEGHQVVYMLDGTYDSSTDMIEWNTGESYNYLTNTQANQAYASKTHVHYQNKTATTVENFINDTSLNEGSYRVITNDNKIWYVDFDMNYVVNTRTWENIQRYYEATNPNVVYVRTGSKLPNLPRTWNEPVRYIADLATVASTGDYNDLDNTPDLATEQNDGLLSSDDKKILNNLNPNIEKTISNLNASEFNVINAKQNNALGLVMAVEPTISQQIRTINLLNVDVFTPGFYIGSNGALASNTNDHVGDFIPVSPGDDIYYTGTIGPTNSGSINRRLHVYTANQTWIKQINFAGNLKVGDNWSTHGIVPSNGAYVRVSWGVEDTNVMITIGAPDKYYPYYMTPFAPTSSVNFKVGHTSDPEDATSYTFNVPAAAGNLYGLKFDPVKGKLWKVTEHIASYNGETLPGQWLSDRDTYLEGTTPQTGAEVVYRLADEDIVEYDCAPMTIPLSEYENYFFIENGMFIELSYYAATIAIDHLTIYSGVTFGDTNILETDVIGWNRAAGLIDTKADLVGAQLTGAVTAPTLGITSNSDRIATTAFVQQMLHTLAPFETTAKASKNYEVGEYLTYTGNLYKVTAAIAKNANLVVGTNIEATDVATELNLLRSLISS